MIFRLHAARQISKLSASKLFTKTFSTLVTAALLAILWLSMALYSVSQVGFGAVDYAAVQIGGSFVDNAYSVIGAVANSFFKCTRHAPYDISHCRLHSYYLLLAYARHFVLSTRQRYAKQRFLHLLRLSLYVHSASVYRFFVPLQFGISIYAAYGSAFDPALRTGGLD